MRLFIMNPFCCGLLLFFGVASALSVIAIRTNESFDIADITVEMGSSSTGLSDGRRAGDWPSSITIDTGNIQMNSTGADQPSSQRRTRQPRSSGAHNRATNYNCTSRVNGSVTQTSCSSEISPESSSQITRQERVETTCGDSSVRQTTRITGNNRTVRQSSVSTSTECK